MLDEHKKQKPGGQRDGVLYHYPQRQTDNRPHSLKINPRHPQQSETATVDAKTREDDKKHQRHKFAERRADSSASNAECLAAKLAKHEYVVEQHIGEHHHDGVVGEYACALRANIERLKHTAGKGKEEAIDTVVEISLSLGKHIGRRHHHREDAAVESLTRGKQHDGKCHKEI